MEIIAQKGSEMHGFNQIALSVQRALLDLRNRLFCRFQENAQAVH